MGASTHNILTVQGLRSHPLGPEVELSSFSGNSSVEFVPSPRSCEASPRLIPLAEPESRDADGSQQGLIYWNEDPQQVRQAKQVHEHEMAFMGRPHSMPAATLPGSKKVASPESHQHITDSHTAQPIFQTSSSPPESDASEQKSSLTHKLLSQEAALDDAFPSIRKITPHGSPGEEDAPLFAELQPSNEHQVYSSAAPFDDNNCPDWDAWLRHAAPNQIKPASTPEQLLVPMQHPLSPTPETLSGSQRGQTSAMIQATHDLSAPSAPHLARVNTVISGAASPTRSHPQDQPTTSVLQNGDLSQRQTNSQGTSTTAAGSALSQLLQADTQPSTGTPMARDLTEALTALASNKRLLSSMQASRSFSSPDLLSLAQQLHDSGHWSAVQDIVQHHDQEDQSDAASPHANYGTVVGRPHMGGAKDEGRSPITLPMQHGSF